MRKIFCFVALLCPFIPFAVLAQEAPYNGLDNHLSSLYRLSNARTLSISPENPTGEKGKGGAASEGTGAKAARDLGKGWKISPSVDIAAGTTYVVAEITGPGAIQHIWMTPTGIVAVLHPAHVLGRRERTVRGSAAR